MDNKITEKYFEHASDRSNFIAHLTKLFRDLFKHFADKLEKNKN